MRQNGPFPSTSQQQQPEQQPPSRQEILRRRISRYYGRSRHILFLAACILLALLSVFLYDKTKPPPQRLTQRDIDAAVERYLETAPPKPSYQSLVYEFIRPSIVRVRATVPGKNGKPDTALGTGVVVRDDGLILTSLHIVRNATEVTVTFADGSESKAEVVVAQPENDLAALQPEEIPDDLVPATLGGGVRVGDEVVAVGNPFGIPYSLTSGVVSGLGRSFKSPQTGETLSDLIQFDAAVNPGNSGGPLVNRNGEVVGIVTALLNPTEQEVFIGIGFAVPMETAGGAIGAPPV